MKECMSMKEGMPMNECPHMKEGMPMKPAAGKASEKSPREDAASAHDKHNHPRDGK